MNVYYFLIRKISNHYYNFVGTNLIKYINNAQRAKTEGLGPESLPFGMWMNQREPVTALGCRLGTLRTTRHLCEKQNIPCFKALIEVPVLGKNQSPVLIQGANQLPLYPRPMLLPGNFSTRNCNNILFGAEQVSYKNNNNNQIQTPT